MKLEKIEGEAYLAEAHQHSPASGPAQDNDSAAHWQVGPASQRRANAFFFLGMCASTPMASFTSTRPSIAYK
jgi:hypothetical protein